MKPEKYTESKAHFKKRMHDSRMASNRHDADKWKEKQARRRERENEVS